LSSFFTGALNAAGDKQNEGPVMPKNIVSGRTVSIVTLDPMYAIMPVKYVLIEKKSKLMDAFADDPTLFPFSEPDGTESDILFSVIR
jgi:hypothetical protein